MTGVEIGVAVVGVLGTAGGLGALAKVIFDRGKGRAETAQILTGTALTLVNELEEGAREARQEIQAARSEARAAQDEARAAWREAHQTAFELHRLRTAIMSPGVTVDELRAMVSADPDRSGRNV